MIREGGGGGGAEAGGAGGAILALWGVDGGFLAGTGGAENIPLVW